MDAMHRRWPVGRNTSLVEGLDTGGAVAGVGVSLGDAEFVQITNGTGWGFDALLQAALNAWLARGENEEGFSTLLKESLYRTLLTEARRFGIERQLGTLQVGQEGILPTRMALGV